LEKQDIAELSSSSVGEVIVKESLKEDESAAMKLKEEVSLYTKSELVSKIFHFVFILNC
jgi:hypothetical protein